MSATISNKLSNSFEGALAGGGDPASSPLYVFGPFLRLIVVAGVAQITFGASVWLAVFSVVMVSAMYRQVMRWVTDGSGGSGLSEEEFGGWAVKINASITIIEYALTFLVSMAALVTFIADRFIILNDHIFGLQYRVLLAIFFTIITCWTVNRGPKISARAFGPATAAVLLLLWGMVIVTIYKTGFHLPDLYLKAFSLKNTPDGSTYLNLTLGGYARILALMTGIEVFANLVAAYDGTREQRSKKAFGSLLIIMGTTAVTMLIVGPAIMVHSDPLNEHVSVFTQTMDFLLPSWLSYTGTLIGVAVLLSAAASAAQGVQNLSLGLRYRHYIPAKFGQRNKHDVADKPVWTLCWLLIICFLLFGTREDTYLALYAAGVFVLLSMTGWAASKRLLRMVKEGKQKNALFSLIGTVIAALLTSVATLIIFEERFSAGAWSYFLMVPVLYAVFTYYRKHLSAPNSVEDRLGLIMSGQGFVPQMMYEADNKKVSFSKIVFPLSGNALGEQILPMILSVARSYNARLELLMVNEDKNNDEASQREYLEIIMGIIAHNNIPCAYAIRSGEATSEIDRYAEEIKADLIAMTTSEDSVTEKIISENIANTVIKKTLTPMLIIRPTDDWHSRHSNFKRILVALDGSAASESVLPYIQLIAGHYKSEVTLLSVPEGSESEQYTGKIQTYLDDIASKLKAKSVNVTTSVLGSGPARTILAMAQEQNIDLIMMASHGSGGIERPKIHLGSVTERVLQNTLCPVFVVPLTKSGD